jgi:RNA polymerase sigma-70 factor (ECF subfamily)
MTDLGRTEEEKKTFEEMLSYKEVVFRICLGFSKNPWDAEDLSQEVYLKAWRKLESLKNTNLIRAWLFRVTKNTCLDHINKMRLRRLFQMHPEKEPQDRNTPEILLENQQQLDLLKKSVSRLSKKLKEVFVLKEYGHLSYQEIAASLGIKEGTVMSRLNRARKEVFLRMRRENHDK